MSTLPEPPASQRGPALPGWARSLAELYESNAANQFIIYGNISDRMVLPPPPAPRLGALSDFLLGVLLPRFDVVLSYDVGNGIRVDKGGEIFSKWPHFQESQKDWKAPRAAVETLTRYFRYCANLTRLNQPATQVGCILKNADLLLPALQGGFDYDLSALASLIRDWSSDALLANHTLASFLLTENLNDLHPLIVNNPRVARMKIELPSPVQLLDGFRTILPACSVALADFSSDLPALAEQLSGATMGAVESVVKTKEHRKEHLASSDLSALKKDLLERDINGLIEFIETPRTLDDLYGLDKVKTWLRQDIELWEKNDVAALPKGYLLCGPVGTGKTFLVECLAGEASVPIVKMKNFRDKWIGSSEGNLEKIFRLIHALGRCYVFIDEADQALGRREANSGDSGVGGRIYSDLKRPGRIDVKIPLFPTTTAREGFDLLRRLAQKRGLSIPDSSFSLLESRIPPLLTPGAAEALVMNIYRQVRTTSSPSEEVLSVVLSEYVNPIASEVMEFQIQLAAGEASSIEFVPAPFRRNARAG